MGPIGTRATPGKRLVAMMHDIDWADDPQGQAVRAAEIEAVFIDDSRRPLQIRALPARYYLKGGLYGGLDGWFQGDDKGKLHMAHERWDLRDSAVRRVVRTLSDHVIEVRDGNSVCLGIMEYGVGARYERYANVRRHPPI